MSLRDDAIEALLQQKLWIEDNWTRLEGGCKSEEEKAVLRGSYVRARDQYNDAINKSLVMNEGEITGLLDQLVKARKHAEDDLAALAGVADVLDKIAQGVEVGGKILRLLG